MEVDVNQAPDSPRSVRQSLDVPEEFDESVPGASIPTSIATTDPSTSFADLRIPIPAPPDSAGSRIALKRIDNRNKDDETTRVDSPTSSPSIRAPSLETPTILEGQRNKAPKRTHQWDSEEEENVEAVEKRRRVE